MTPAETLELLAKLGPLAREHGIETIEFGDSAGPVLELKAVKFRHGPQFAAVPLKPRTPATDDGPPKEERPRFAGRTAEEIRDALPNWGRG